MSRVMGIGGNNIFNAKFYFLLEISDETKGNGREFIVSWGVM